MVIYKPVEVKIKKITSFVQKKCINGSITIKGTCEATTEDDSFEFNFEYIGKAYEDEMKIINYLKNQAQILERERRKPPKTTLSDLIHSLIEYD